MNSVKRTSALSSSPSAFAAQEETYPRSSNSSTMDIKGKRRSYLGPVDQPPVTRTTARVISQSEARQISATPTSQHSSMRKSQSQRELLTSESEYESSTQSHPFQDRARHSVTDDSVLSELEAVKARVLEMERENRSHLDLHQSPQVITPQSLDNAIMEDHSSEKLHRSSHRHLSATIAGDNSGDLWRSTHSLASSTQREKPNGTLRRAASVTGSALTGRAVDPPTRTPPKASSQPSTLQHLVSLQEAFATFEKAMMTTGRSGATSAVQDMSKVVSSAISMNQTIRSWIKSDVSPVDGGSMISFQRSCDEQVRRLTWSLLNMASMQSEVDRSPAQHESVSGSMANERSYLSTQSTGSQRVAQRQQRPSLAMLGTDFGGRNGSDQGVSYLARSSNYEPGGSVTPNGMSSSGHWVKSASMNASTIDSRARPTPKQGYGSEYGHDRRYSTVPGPRPSHAGSVSSRNPSPPDAYGSVIQSAPLPEFSRALSPSHNRSLQSPVGMTSSQLARRQANVRDIVARYSRNGLRSPTFDDQEQDMTRNSQMGFPHENDIQQQYLLDRQYQRSQYAPMDAMAASVEFSSLGHPRPASASRRPLSQQDLHHHPGAGLPDTPLVRRGSIIQRSGRYANDNVFSEDESIGGLEAWKIDRVPGRSKSGSFAIRLQQIRGRNRDQLQPLHQQLEQFRHGEHAGGHYEEGQQQQLLQEEYADRVEREVFLPETTPRFAQGRPSPPSSRDSIQRQAQREPEDFRQSRNGRQATKHHHPDMMMATPAIPSSNSSPSSSSRVEAPSLVISHANMEGRYTLSPRGAADIPSLRRQQSTSSIGTTFSDRNQYPVEMQIQQSQARRTLSIRR